MVSAAVSAHYVCVLQPELHVDICPAVQHVSKAGGQRAKVVSPQLAKAASHERVAVLYNFCGPAHGQGRCPGGLPGLREHLLAGRHRECGKEHSHEAGVQQRNGFEAGPNQSVSHIYLAGF